MKKYYALFTAICIATTLTAHTQTWNPPYFPQSQQQPLPQCPSRNLMFTTLTASNVDTRFSQEDIKRSLAPSSNCSEVLNHPSLIRVGPGETIRREILFRNPTQQNILFDFTGGFVCASGDNPSAADVNCRNNTARSFDINVISGVPSTVRKIFTGFDHVAFRVRLSPGQSTVVEFTYTAPLCQLNFCQRDQWGRTLEFRYNYTQFFGGVSMNTREQREFFQHFNPLPNISLATTAIASPTPTATPTPTSTPTPTQSPAPTANPEFLPKAPNFILPIPQSACVNRSRITLEIDQSIPLNNWSVQYRTAARPIEIEQSPWRTPTIESSRRHLTMHIPVEVHGTGSTYVQVRLRNIIGWGPASQVILACTTPLPSVPQLENANCGNRTTATFTIGDNSQILEYRLTNNGIFSGNWSRLPNAISSVRILDISQFALSQKIEIQVRRQISPNNFTQPRIFTLCEPEIVPQAIITMPTGACAQMTDRLTFRVEPYNVQKDFRGFPVNNQHTTLDVRWRLPQGNFQTSQIETQPSGMGPYTVTITGLPSTIRSSGIVVQAQWVAAGVAGGWSTGISCDAIPDNITITSLSGGTCNRTTETASFIVNQSGTAPTGSVLYVQVSNGGLWENATVTGAPSLSGGRVTFRIPLSYRTTSLSARAFWRGVSGRDVSNTSETINLCAAPPASCFPSSLVSQYNSDTGRVAITVPPCPEARSIRITVASDSQFRNIINGGRITLNNVDLRTSQAYTYNLPVVDGQTYYVQVTANREPVFSLNNVVFASINNFFVVRKTDQAIIPTASITGNCESGIITARFTAPIAAGHRLLINFRTTSQGITPFRLRNSISLNPSDAGSSISVNLNLTAAERTSGYEVHAVVQRVSDGQNGFSSNAVICNNHWLSQIRENPSITNVVCAPIAQIQNRRVDFRVNFLGILPTTAIWQGQYRIPNTTQWKNLPEITINSMSQLNSLAHLLPMEETLAGRVSLRGRLINANARNEATEYSQIVEICEGISQLPRPVLNSVECGKPTDGFLTVLVEGNSIIPPAAKLEVHMRFGNSEPWSPNQNSLIYETAAPTFAFSIPIYVNYNKNGVTQIRARYTAPGITGDWSNIVSCETKAPSGSLIISRVQNNCDINIITLERPESPSVRGPSFYFIKMRKASNDAVNNNKWYSVSEVRIEANIVLPMQFLHPQPKDAADRLNVGVPDSQKIDFDGGYEIKVVLLEGLFAPIESNILVCR